MTALAKLQDWAMGHKSRCFVLEQADGYGANAFLVSLSGHNININVVSFPLEDAEVQILTTSEKYTIFKLSNKDQFHRVCDPKTKESASYETTVEAAIHIFNTLLHA